MCKQFLSLLYLLLVLALPVMGDEIPDYLCFTNVDTKDGVIKFVAQSSAADKLEYTTDLSSSQWIPYNITKNSNGIELKVNNRVFFRAKGTNGKNSTFSENGNDIIFSATINVAASGNIMSLLDSSCKQTKVPEYTFEMLFYNCSTLITAPELPATDISTSCYYRMFEGCVNLETAPELPATDISTSCYYGMFEGCVNLETAPELPATVLAESCYQRMFYGCSELKTAPILSSTSLVKRCYNYMFYGCTNINSISINFTNWNDEENATYNWLGNVATIGKFICPLGLDVTKKEASYVPKGWTVVRKVTIADGEDYTNASDMAANINYTRTYSGKWQPLFVPFAIPYEKWKDDFYIAEPTSCDGSSMTITKLSENTATTANGIYFIKAKEAGEKTISIDDATLAVANSVEKTIGDYVFVGNYTGIDKSAWSGTYSAFYALGGGKLIQADLNSYENGEIVLKGQRWYLKTKTTTSNAKSLTIDLKDEIATGIKDIKNTDEVSSACYNMTGQRVDASANGIVIKNGKKYVNR